ncbi:MAG: ADP-ribosylglycohydrolase family protein [Candidatus Sericytochromatia bacterium]|nr:ADP-ribosylglycohydrolase family protein [Candidatus Sericytochromatia bacterium]
MSSPSDAERRFTLVAASLIADALVLPVHWIYDPTAIAARGRRTELEAPDASSYHGGQPAGGQTHYGQQALTLLDALAASGGRFDLGAFGRAWQQLWAGEPGYRDGATRQTLAHLEAGVAWPEAGSSSSDWGGASRCAALVAATLEEDEETALKAVMAQTEATHRDPVVVEAAAFWTRAVRHVWQGVAVPEALAQAASADYAILAAAEMLARAEGAATQGAVAAVQTLGAACGVQGALPSTMAIALAHPQDLETALIENAMAGGDSAARGLALGMLLGAAPGAVLPARWLAGWQARARVEQALMVAHA